MSKFSHWRSNWLLFSLCIYTLANIVESHTLEFPDETCKLANGKNGTCVDNKNCATLYEIANGKNQQRTCGKNGSKNMVCCEIRRQENLKGVGSISLRKCHETYFPLSPHLIRYNISTWVNKDGYIIGMGGYGGQRASPGQFKHMTALGFENGTQIAWLCGGSLISEKFVMTAAHCIASRIYGTVKFIRVGDLDLDQTNDSTEPQDFGVARIFIHPDYAPPTVYNDIALIEIDAEANYTKFVRAACLNTHLVIDPPAYSWSATGWGITQYEGQQSNYLQEMTLDEYPMDKCREIYQDTGKRQLPYGLNETIQLCAGSKSADTCQGDSGGPLQMENYKYLNGHTIIGITSFGKPCGLTKAPGVYTRVSHFVGWIESIVWPKKVEP